jgi:hypothetical protein
MATENSNTGYLVPFPLHYHNHKERPLHRLPFVGGKSPRHDEGISFWNVRKRRLCGRGLDRRGSRLDVPQASTR